MEMIGPPAESHNLMVTGVSVKSSVTDTSSPLPSETNAPSGSMFSVTGLDRSFRMTKRLWRAMRGPSVKQFGNFPQLCGPTRRARVPGSDPDNVIIPVGDIEQTIFRPPLRQQFVFREVGGRLGDPSRLPAEELAGLLETGPAGGADAARQVNVLEGSRRIQGVPAAHTLPA